VAKPLLRSDRSLSLGFSRILAASLLLAVMAMLSTAGAQDPPPPDWNPADYNAVRAPLPKDANPVQPEGVERFDKRAAETGSNDLMTILGLPQRDPVKASMEKAGAVVARRDLNIGPENASSIAGGGDLGITGFNPDDSTKPKDQTQKADEAGSDQEFRISSSDLLDVDVERQMVFGTQRTRVSNGKIELTADRVVIDVTTRGVSAFGRVNMKNVDTGLEIDAESVRFDFRNNRGEATKVRGLRGDLFFLGDDLEPRPTFQQLNERESLILGGSVSTSEPPIPQFRIRGREVVFLRDDRFWVLHAVLYVREFPILYLPVYSRSLKEKGNWNVYVGYDKKGDYELGVYGIVSYDHYYRYFEPNPLNDEQYLKRSYARWTPSAYIFQNAPGGGLDAVYDYDYGKHKGRLFSFFTPDDSERKLDNDEDVGDLTQLEQANRFQPDGDDEEDGDGQRYAVDWGHRTELLKDLDLILSADWASDGEVYHDIFDNFTEKSRGRMFERTAEAALQYRQDNWIARVKADITERITRNRLTAPFEPGDDDGDFDENPDNTQQVVTGDPQEGEEPELELVGVALDEEPTQDGENALNNKRFRTVSERYGFDLSTNRVKISTTPVYWTFDLRAVNALDKGLNHFDEDDDSVVKAVDAYNSFTFVMKFSEWLTWRNQIGFGVGMAEREDDEWKFQETLDNGSLREQIFTEQGVVLGGPRALGDEFPVTVGAITFLDDSTIRVGRREVSLDDYSKTFFYADYTSTLTARLSEAWTFAIGYLIREGTDDSLFELYERLGMNEARQDIYAYRALAHRVGAVLQYDGLYPRIKASISGFKNLQSDSDILPNETLETAAFALDWTSLDDEWKVSGTAAWANSQIRDPTDRDEFEQGSVVYIGQIDYFPSHERYWAQLQGTYTETLDEDPVDERLRAQRADDPLLGDEFAAGKDLRRVQLTQIFGFKAGPKYEIELQARWDDQEEDFDELALVILRDLRDATFLVALSAPLKEKKDQRGDDSDEQLTQDADTADEGVEYEREFEVQTGLSYKIPNADRLVGPAATTTIQHRRSSELELEG